MHEPQRSRVGFGDRAWITPSQPVAAVRHEHQLVSDVVASQLLGHRHGLLDRHVRVCFAMDQKRRRIFRSHVVDGCVLRELLALGDGVQAGHDGGSRVVLPKVQVQRSTLARHASSSVTNGRLAR